MAADLECTSWHVLDRLLDEIVPHEPPPNLEAEAQLDREAQFEASMKRVNREPTPRERIDEAIIRLVEEEQNLAVEEHGHLVLKVLSGDNWQGVRNALEDVVDPWSSPYGPEGPPRP